MGIEYEFHSGQENAIKVSCKKCGIIFERSRGVENDLNITEDEVAQAQMVASGHEHEVIIYQSVYL